MRWTRTIDCKGDAVKRCIPAELLLKEVSAIEDMNIDMSFAEHTVKVHKRCEIYTLSADEFPAGMDFKGVTLDVDRIPTALKRVIRAAGESDTRYVLNGVFLDLNAGTMVATDGNRLHLDNITVRGEGIPAAGRILPRKAAELIMKYPVKNNAGQLRDIKRGVSPAKGKHTLTVYGQKVEAGYEVNKTGYMTIEWNGPVSSSGYLSENEYKGKDLIAKHDMADYLQGRAEAKYRALYETQTMTVGDRHISLPIAEGVLTVKCIEGQYPDYKKVVPTKLPIKLRFQSKDLFQVLGGAVPVDQKLKLTINGNLRIQTENAGVGSYKWQIACSSIGKAKGEVGFIVNSTYLLDAIRAYAAESAVEIEMSEGLSPILINQKAVVMPMRA
jgi:DNA polymerase III sliding clamp (beta) subunit (PCNA family)